MVGGFFPTPYPDECLYSILCRYCVRISCTQLRLMRKLLFGGQQSLASSVFFPIRLDLVEHWYGAASGVTRKLIAEKHSMHPYAAIVYPAKFRQQVDAVISGASAPEAFDFTGTQRTHRLWQKYLRYCPDCVHDDICSYGETYWHRSHQLPAMVYCTKHRARLIDSNVEVIGANMAFRPASAESLLGRRIAGDEDPLALHKDQFIKIGIESEWLLQHGADIDWGPDLLAKYKRYFRDKGISTVQGRCDYALIANTFETYWGKEFLECLKSELSDNRAWIRKIYNDKMVSFKPIYHILLMCFLGDSIEAFLDYVPQKSVFGNGPWACLNKLCDNYEVGGVETVDIRFSCGSATGFFKCSACGMVYKQRYWRQRFSPLYIVDYGSLWKERLLRCVQDEKLDISTTVVIMKSTPGVVRWQMEKLGVLRKTRRPRKPLYGGIGAKATYRVQVLALCEQYDEVTSAVLKLQAPNAYSYLCKFDLDWLHEHIVLKANSKRHRDE